MSINIGENTANTFAIRTVYCPYGRVKHSEIGYSPDSFQIMGQCLGGRPKQRWKDGCGQCQDLPGVR